MTQASLSTTATQVADITTITEKVAGGDGYTASAGGIEQLVQAMASFAPPASGETTLPPELAANLAPALSANWQHQ
jgi:hypothetical protein